MRTRRKRKKFGLFKVLLLIVVLIAGAVIARQYLPWKHYADMEHGWKLILVNKDNYIDRAKNWTLTRPIGIDERRNVRSQGSLC